MICHNCKDGKVDGGFEKRIISETQTIESQRKQELLRVKEKDKNKSIEIKRKINNDYYKKLKEKQSEIPNIISICGFCHGKGWRINYYGVDPPNGGNKNKY